MHPDLDTNVGGTDIAVTHVGGSGEMEWIYVANNSGATIQQGVPVKRDAGKAGSYEVEACVGTDNSDDIIGVAQFDIADTKAAWILRRGVGQVLAGGAVAADTGMVPGAGVVIAEVAKTDSALGNSLDGAGGAGLFTAFVNCVG